MSKGDQHGFTLIELLVATAIFAVLAVMSWQGLQVVLDAREKVEDRAGRLARLQMLMVTLERDIEQAVARPVRDNFGDSQPALRSGPEGFELTRAGWRNPAGHARSELQRVAWRMEDAAVIRNSWQALDRAHSSEPYAQRMIGGVAALSVRCLDTQRNWQLSWPPSGYEEGVSPPLPMAMEVTVELEDWGEIKRLFRIAGPVPEKKQDGPAG